VTSLERRQNNMPNQGSSEARYREATAFTASDVQTTEAAVTKRPSEAGNAQDKPTDLARSAAAKIDEKRETAAGALESAAGTLESAAVTMREKAESLPGGKTVSNVAHTAAGKLQYTADYVASTIPKI
jgi:hypothetical protein